MAIYIGNQKYGINIGSTKIAEAYVGSTLVFKLPSSSYDSYRVRLYRGGSYNFAFTMAGLRINGVQATSAQVIDIRYLDYLSRWMSFGNKIESAIAWQGTGYGISNMYELEITFTASNAVSKIEIYQSAGNTNWSATIDVYGTSAGTETLLGTTSSAFASKKIHVINL